MSEEIKTNRTYSDVDAFEGDAKLAEYKYRLENGLLSEEEKEDYNRVRKALGFEDDNAETK